LLLVTTTWQNVALAASLPIVSSHHPTAIINSINNTDSATTTYRYNDLDQLTSVQNPHDWSAREQTYSQDGDLITAADGKEYTFNGQDQLVQVKLKNGKTINYQYYPNGLRSDRIIKNGEHVRFYYDQSGHVLATENVTATEKIKHSFFLSGLGKDMATVADYNTQNNQDSYYVHQNGDTVMMLARSVGNGVLKAGGLEVMGNQHYDAYGNPKALGDSYLAKAFKFAHLGNSNQDDNSNNNSLNTNAANNFTYKGEYQDVDSNIVYLKARDYDPVSARFLSRDSYDVWNHYSYADSDPVNKIDPSGHVAQWIGAMLNFIGILGSIGCFIGIPNMRAKISAIAAFISASIGLITAFVRSKNQLTNAVLNVSSFVLGAVSIIGDIYSANNYKRIIEEPRTVYQNVFGVDIYKKAEDLAKEEYINWEETMSTNNQSIVKESAEIMQRNLIKKLNSLIPFCKKEEEKLALYACYIINNKTGKFPMPIFENMKNMLSTERAIIQEDEEIIMDAFQMAYDKFNENVAATMRDGKIMFGDFRMRTLQFSDDVIMRYTSAERLTNDQFDL
ncbi:RHS repeat domain-containing protein, partial [Cysteiniphilum marinum]